MDRFAQHVIDDSAAVTIQMPEVLKPVFENLKWPVDYWVTFNKGMALYASGQFQGAKNEFVRLTAYSTPHNGLYPSLIRSYRKIIKEKTQSGQFVDAYTEFGEFFRVCEGHITQRDVGNFIKVAETVENNNPLLKVGTIEVPSIKRNARIPEVQINKSASDNLKLVREIPRTKDKLVLGELDRRDNADYGTRSRNMFGRYRDIGLTSQGTILTRSYFNNELQEFDRAFVLLRDVNGSVVKEWTLSHSLYRFGSASHSDTFVGISDKAVLYVYSLVHGCVGTYHINDVLPDVYDGRQLLWPENGNYFGRFTSCIC